MSRNDELFARAQRTIPAGVNSPVRAFRSVGAPNDSPCVAASRTARTTSGCAWPTIAGPHDPT